MGSEDNDRERVRDIIKRLLNRAVNAEIIKEKPNLYYDAAHQIERLHAENEKLRAVFRVNMLRAFPSMSHEEIDAEIEAAIRESGDE
jgi:hypothetical protein